jgi:hypothetical protein
MLNSEVKPLLYVTNNVCHVCNFTTFTLKFTILLSMATVHPSLILLLDRFVFLSYGKSNSPANEAVPVLTSILFQIDSVAYISIAKSIIIVISQQSLR